MKIYFIIVLFLSNGIFAQQVSRASDSTQYLNINNLLSTLKIGDSIIITHFSFTLYSDLAEKIVIKKKESGFTNSNYKILSDRFAVYASSIPNHDSLIIRNELTSAKTEFYIKEFLSHLTENNSNYHNSIDTYTITRSMTYFYKQNALTDKEPFNELKHNLF